jgi:HD-GYP domain-containing protein (c-di-GMP phosphodiesterase class II)
MQRVAHYARLIGGALREAGTAEVDDEFLEQVFAFAALRDLGMIGVPERVLAKRGRLTARERARMATHTREGGRMVAGIAASLGLGRPRSLAMLKDIVELHHEALDGSGYPYGLRGGAIPLSARIVAVAETFDALTSRRPWRRAASNARALRALQDQAGRTLDPACVQALAARAGELAGIQERFSDRPGAGK